MRFTNWRYLWLDDVGVPHTQPIVALTLQSLTPLPKLLLAKGERVERGKTTAALVSPGGRCWAWNLGDTGEWKTVDEAVAALLRRMGKSTPKLVPEAEAESEQEPEPAE